MKLFSRKHKLVEAGKRNSAVDAARIQESHDHMVGLGATCSEAALPAKEAARQKALTEALRVDDGFSSRIDTLRKAAQAIYGSDYDGPYVYVRDCFDTDFIVQCGTETYQIPYTLDADGNPTLGEPIEVDVAYIPSDENDGSETAGDEIVEGALPAKLRKRLFKKATEMDSEKVAGPVTEAASAILSDEYIQLRESALAADGTGQIRIITPGWGSSGYYPAEVLKRDGPKVFTSGLKMFWNHQTSVEESERPEGDLNDLAAELTANAKWNEKGSEGPGLYAPIQAFEAYTGPINDLAKSIGVSIRAAGRAAKGKAEGREGPIIQSLESAKSIDFVTAPGAGGKVLQLFEAARRTPPQQTQESQMTEVKNLQEANALLATQAAALTLQEANTAKQAALIAKLQETVLLREAATFVADALTSSNLPTITKKRLGTELVASMPVKEGAIDTAAYKILVDAKVQEAVAEIAAITGAGEVRGLGAAATADETKTLAESAKSLEASFATLGLSESAAKLAAKGRN